MLPLVARHQHNITGFYQISHILLLISAAVRCLLPIYSQVHYHAGIRPIVHTRPGIFLVWSTRLFITDHPKEWCHASARCVFIGTLCFLYILIPLNLMTDPGGPWPLCFFTALPYLFFYCCLPLSSLSLFGFGVCSLNGWSDPVERLKDVSRVWTQANTGATSKLPTPPTPQGDSGPRGPPAAWPSLRPRVFHLGLSLRSFLADGGDKAGCRLFAFCSSSSLLRLNAKAW